ncbi:helix-turn-helix domain-containing protein [Evansella tamaricis]|uniref:Helix-turn-helix domain-containing protein n=1 Tax=Evansella tamaricis TaxID=2069301 RepID=A0ABS6JQ86_9BACI|nr:helix-turn-helix domain-containing protein [Evansella tamaricis]MBU9714458.1 helix-turn-helix domain-containing protein [Evansella tamaricis]
MQKYLLNFEGEIGDFIKKLRKHKKINSIELSRSVGKSDAYISQIENNRNKKPDYSVLYEVFKQLEIEEKKIEDYLEHFGFLSPEREAHEEALMIERYENPDWEYTEQQYDDWNQSTKNYIETEERKKKNKEIEEQSGMEFIYEIMKADINDINKVLNNLKEHDPQNGSKMINGLSKSFNSMATNVTLYRFLLMFHSENLSILDNRGLTKVLNTLYEEINRVEREKIAFGKPRQKKLIKEL